MCIRDRAPLHHPHAGKIRRVFRQEGEKFAPHPGNARAGKAELGGEFLPEGKGGLLRRRGPEGGGGAGGL